MEIVLIPSLIVGVWLVLSHLRKQYFLKEYMDLQHKAIEKGISLPEDLKQFVRAKTDWSQVMLRVGIISLVLGLMGAIIGFFILPSQPGVLKDGDAAAICASFWAFGLLFVAFGIGNLICWLLLDRRQKAGTAKEG